MPGTPDRSAVVVDVKMVAENQSCPSEEAVANLPEVAVNFRVVAEMAEVHSSEAEVGVSWDLGSEKHEYSTPMQIRRGSWVFVVCLSEPGWCWC